MNSTLGNLALNAFLKQNSDTLQNIPAPNGIKKEIIDRFIAFTYKTRNLHDLNQIEISLQKLQVLLNKQKQNLNIDEQDKITLAEISNIFDLADIYQTLETYSTKISGNHKLEQLLRYSQQAKGLVEELELITKHDLQQLKPGIVSLNSRDKYSVRGLILSLLEKFAYLFSMHEHAAMIYINDQKIPKYSEILNIPYPRDQQRPVDSRLYLFADSYQIKFENLVNANDMVSIYGENWKEKLTEKITRIEKKIHGDRVRFKNLDASPNISIATIFSGAANLIPFFGHSQLQTNDFKQIHDKIIGIDPYYKNHPESTMLCSEFCAQTIIATLIELKDDIKKDAIQRNVVLTGNVVTIPFGIHERLSSIHPDRLLQLLEKHHCVERVTINIDKFISEPAPAANRYSFFGKGAQIPVQQTNTATSVAILNTCIPPDSSPRTINYKQ